MQRVIAFLISFLVFSQLYCSEKTVFFAILPCEPLCLSRYLQTVDALDYNKKNIMLYLDLALLEPKEKKLLQNWAQSNAHLYGQICIEQGKKEESFACIKEKSLRAAKKGASDYYFFADCNALLTPCTLKELIQKEKPIISPLLHSIPIEGDLSCNFFYDVDAKGYYKDHLDYYKIYHHTRVGTFQVPLVNSVYLIQSKYLDKLTFMDETKDWDDIVFARWARKNGVEQYICNEKNFGFLAQYNDSESYESQVAKIEAFLQEAEVEQEAYIQAFPHSNYRICTAGSQGSFYVDLDADDVIKNELKEGKEWELQTTALIKKYVQPSSVVLDVGAHIGTHTVTMSKCTGKKGKVIAFEPQKKIYRELFWNLKLNTCENVEPLHTALGAENRVIYLESPVQKNEGSRFISAGMVGEPVKMRTLDSYNFDSISFMKVDVENYEDAFLDGAKETILRCKPVMLIEIQGNSVLSALNGEDLRYQMTQKTIAKIQSLGYSVEHFHHDDYLALPIQPAGNIRLEAPKKKYKLSICAIFKDEGRFLKEWIEYHRLVGVEHFYLYNNESSDDFMSVLDPYIKEGVVTLIDWPDIQRDDIPQNEPYRWVLTTQVPCYVDACRNRTRNDTQWLCLIDLDEYIVPVGANTLTDMLEKYKDSPGIELLWHTYGTSGAVMQNDKLLIELLHRTCEPDDGCMKSVWKTILKPELFDSFSWNAHQCFYINGKQAAKIEKKEARINHYINRTCDYFMAKMKKRQKGSNYPYSESMLQKQSEFGNQVEDEERVISRFIPELRQRMGMK